MMEREEIIMQALKAGIKPNRDPSDDELERFAWVYYRKGQEDMRELVERTCYSQAEAIDFDDDVNAKYAANYTVTLLIEAILALPIEGETE